MASCLRNGTPYQLRDTAGRPITEQQGRAIIEQRYSIPAKTRTARRQISTPTERPDATSGHHGTDGPSQESLNAPRHRPFQRPACTPPAAPPSLDTG